MNEYQIKIKNPLEETYMAIFVEAENDDLALEKAKKKLYDYQNQIIFPFDKAIDKIMKNCYKDAYKDYRVESILHVKRNCNLQETYDIISEESQHPIIQGNNEMAFFNVNWNNYTDQLASIAAPEVWTNNTYPNNGMLANYIVKTYNKLQSERNVVFGQDYALFNTGLFTKYYEAIYAYQSGSEISFLTSYELSRLGITERPERANYFENPELLLFDWHYPIDVYYKHILDDERNKNRLPKEFLDSDNMINILNGAIDIMKKRVSANYKLAIPQYYDGKIQLLLPLCLLSDNKPDVAIAVTKKDNCYQGHTCLTLDMAYNNARLIAKPENSWLTK